MLYVDTLFTVSKLTTVVVYVKYIMHNLINSL